MSELIDALTLYESSDSAAQRMAQPFMLDALSRELGHRLRTPPQGELAVDGHCPNPPILCEAWAHIGPPKAAQSNKVLSDAFRLVYVADLAVRAGRRRPRLILCFCDSEAARPFRDSRGWRATALTHFGIERYVIDLPADVRARVMEAQRLQDLTRAVAEIAEGQAERPQSLGGLE